MRRPAELSDPDRVDSGGVAGALLREARIRDAERARRPRRFARVRAASLAVKWAALVAGVVAALIAVIAAAFAVGAVWAD